MKRTLFLTLFIIAIWLVLSPLVRSVFISVEAADLELDTRNRASTAVETHHVAAAPKQRAVQIGAWSGRGTGNTQLFKIRTSGFLRWRIQDAPGSQRIHIAVFERGQTHGRKLTYSDLATGEVVIPTSGEQYLQIQAPNCAWTVEVWSIEQ